MRKKLKTEKTINIIGAGLAGCEAAYHLAKNGVKVRLYDMKPEKFSPAHSNNNFAELVCSNSLKSNEITNACGLLKQEMRELGSIIIKCADGTSVPAGGALAVNRDLFSEKVTQHIKSQKNIEVVCKEVTEINPDEINIIASGPLTSDNLLTSISKLTKRENLYFFDAAAPIIDGSTIDLGNAFIYDRYGRGSGDYLNCPLNKNQYTDFIVQLRLAEKAKLKDFENDRIFEGCMPVEVMAGRGFDTLRYGPLKPVGLIDPVTNQAPYAAVQLRKENLLGSYYNMVGFQTNLLYSEQKRVFSMIPALKNAEFVKYGLMHKNIYINSPKLLNKYFQLKSNKNIFFAGQIGGVEGYVESAASGLLCAINITNMLRGREMVDFTTETISGALSSYISAENMNFQPMNANFAIIKPLKNDIKDKKQKYMAYAERALNKIKEIREFLYPTGE